MAKLEQSPPRRVRNSDNAESLANREVSERAPVELRKPLHLAQKDGWGLQVTLVWPRVLRMSHACRNTLRDVPGLVFQLVSLDLRVGKHPGRNCPSALHARKSRKVVNCNGLLNTTGFVFHIFHFAHSHLPGVRVFCLQGFPAHRGDCAL